MSDEIEDTVPRCDKCGLAITTGLMAAFCPHGKECEFWVPELDDFLADPHVLVIPPPIRGDHRWPEVDKHVHPSRHVRATIRRARR